MNKLFKVFVVLGLFLLSKTSFAQSISPSTYCNPLNVDYTYMIYNANNDISYRSGADPAVVSFRGEYYMFVTRSLGYWHSTDLNSWDFITPQKWYFQGSNAPAAHNYKDSVLYVTGDPSGSMSILYTDDPKKGDWKAVPSIINDLQDPDLFIDDNGKAYMYWGSSNTYPIRAKTLDKGHRFKPSDSTFELFHLDGDKHGWERFGENHSDTVLKGYMEGPWMTKHNGRYYLQYAAPGTEFNVYGDGVYWSDNPLGPFTYMPSNPFSYKPGGFMNGAGHGSTVIGPYGNYWHFASMAVSVNVNWERRLCMYPTWFDADGYMYSDTRFGDYPHTVPAADKPGAFKGWMLLSYKKPVTASSVLEDHKPGNAVDENVKTFWIAQSNDDEQWLRVDLEKPANIYAIQVNYHDYKSDMYGRPPGLHHRYTIEGSMDGQNWFSLIDQSNNFRDVPNDYEELTAAKLARYIRYNNIHVPTPYLSVSGLRIFGTGTGKTPAQVKNFRVDRKNDRRNATVTWEVASNAQGYNVYWGIAPDKLYNTWMVYDSTKLDMRNLATDQQYYFSIEAFNENGVSSKSPVIKVQ